MEGTFGIDHRGQNYTAASKVQVNDKIKYRNKQDMIELYTKNGVIGYKDKSKVKNLKGDSIFKVIKKERLSSCIKFTLEIYDEKKESEELISKYNIYLEKKHNNGYDQSYDWLNNRIVHIKLKKNQKNLATRNMKQLIIEEINYSYYYHFGNQLKKLRQELSEITMPTHIMKDFEFVIYERWKNNLPQSIINDISINLVLIDYKDLINFEIQNLEKVLNYQFHEKPTSRDSTCWSCKKNGVYERLNKNCSLCGWIICDCTACGCSYDKNRKYHN